MEDLLKQLLKQPITVMDDEPVTFSYLQEGGAGSDVRTMKMEARDWLKQYLPVAVKRVVKWQTSREVDETGGDLVRIWTEDLKGTSLADDCDFVVWSNPDATVGEDFVQFLNRCGWWARR